MTVDGVDMHLDCVVRAFFRRGSLLKLLHGEIDIDVPAAFCSDCTAYRSYTEGLVVSLGMVVRLNWQGGVKVNVEVILWGFC